MWSGLLRLSLDPTASLTCCKHGSVRRIQRLRSVAQARAAELDEQRQVLRQDRECKCHTRCRISTSCTSWTCLAKCHFRISSSGEIAGFDRSANASAVTMYFFGGSCMADHPRSKISRFLPLSSNPETAAKSQIFRGPATTPGGC